MNTQDTAQEVASTYRGGRPFEQTLKILPLLFSGAAVIVSLSTLYLTQLRPARISIKPGEAIQIWHNNLGELNVDMSIAFHNTGNQPLTINSLAMILKDPNTDNALFMKFYGVKKTDPSKSGINLTYESYRFAPLTIPAREEVTKFINFYAGPPGKGWIPKSTRYDIYILGWSSGQEDPDLRAKVQWSFSEADIQAIRANIANTTLANAPGQFIFKQSYGGESRNLSMLEFKNLTE